jgi:hypothetical protein
MSASVTQESAFTDTPSGWASRLTAEFAASRKALKDWHEEAKDSIRAYLNTKDATGLGRQSRFAIYTADTQTQEAILFGNPPKASVNRRFADADDDVARVASEIQERLLNADIEEPSDTVSSAVGHAHWERQVPGFGLVRVRYEMGEPEVIPGKPAQTDPMTGQEIAPAIPNVERRSNEEVETDWVHWGDFLYGVCRVWAECPWLAFASDISRREAAKRFGEEVAERLPVKGKATDSDEKKASSPWDRIRVWEVWVKEERQVFFYVEGWPEVLRPVGVETQENGGQADPLGLDGFFPCPEPMVANVTTDRFVPKPDYALHKPVYEDIDELARRIASLEDTIGVKGAYDKTHKGLERLVNERGNVLIPIENWALLAERGGLRGVVDYWPLEMVASTLTMLQGRMSEKVDQLRQLTGMSDIMRGQASEEGATATEQRIKARFGSVRMERRQKELARFASDVHRLRAEVMAKHFEDATYLARCNCENTPDAKFAPQAVQLLKSDSAKWRIEVKPETISMTDFDELKSERTEVVGAISQYFTAAAPMVQQMPTAMRLRCFAFCSGWFLACVVPRRLRASLIRLLPGRPQQAQQQQAMAGPQPQQPDPKIIAQQLKNQGDLAKVNAERDADIMREQVKVQADAQREENQAIWNVREAAQKHAIAMAGKVLAPDVNNGGGQ